MKETKNISLGVYERNQKISVTPISSLSPILISKHFKYKMYIRLFCSKKWNNNLGTCYTRRVQLISYIYLPVNICTWYSYNMTILYQD